VDGEKSDQYLTDPQDGIQQLTGLPEVMHTEHHTSKQIHGLSGLTLPSLINTCLRLETTQGGVS
jgi:hypothetical protein